ncbi:MAG: DUF5681 domain-containing protein [Casimicrobiaceae bacterium]
MSKSTKKGYTVGYGKPPRASQFQKGRSGNPAGRPAGRPNLATLIEREAAAQVVVTENGRRHTRTKLEVSVAQVMNKSASGDLKAMEMVVRLLAFSDATASGSGPAPDLRADRELAQKLVARLLQPTLPEPKPETSDAE